MTKRQTKFGRPDVNDAAEVGSSVFKTMAAGSAKAQIQGGEPAAPGANALRTTRSALSAVKLARFRRLSELQQ